MSTQQVPPSVGYSIPSSLTEMATNNSGEPRNLKFPDSREVIQRLERACSNRPLDDAAIVICSPEGTRHFAIDKSGSIGESITADNLYVPTTCMVKLYTATLAIEKFATKGIAADDQVSDVVRDLYGVVASPALQGMTLRHLMDSSHGLDDLGMDPYPVTKDGFLDFDGQSRRFAGAPRLIETGRFFSFSDVGMLFIGAFLERMFARRFAELLRDDLLARLASESKRPLRDDAGLGRCCPTAGGGFTTSATDLLDLASHYFTSKGRRNPDAPVLVETMRNKQVGFAGWTSMGTGVGLGWHSYPGAWLGYNGAIAGGGTQMLRMRPEDGMAIAIVSKKLPAHYLAISAFGDLLPEARIVRPPQILTPPEVEDFAKDPNDFVGRFEVATVNAAITQGDGTDFHVTLDNRVPVGPISAPIKRRLRLTRERGFFTMPVEMNFLSYGQVVDLQISGPRRRYLWNGRRLWREAQ